jgi:hypothetical protein
VLFISLDQIFIQSRQARDNRAGQARDNRAGQANFIQVSGERTVRKLKQQYMIKIDRKRVAGDRQAVRQDETIGEDRQNAQETVHETTDMHRVAEDRQTDRMKENRRGQAVSIKG